jgi:glycosyltransferase involved in cell wall biosynthesis
LQKNEFDVCIAGENTSSIPASIFISFLLKTTDIKFVLWSEVREPGNSYLKLEPTWKTALRRAIGIYRKVLYQSADSFLALSEDAERYIRSRGVPRDRIDTGSQVMPASLLTKCEMSEGSESFRILSLGYLRERKGIHHLIDAYRRIRAKRENVELIIVGTGPYEQQLREASRHIPNIQFIGYVSEKAKSQWYRSSDLFVLPTLNDAWGLVVNEALYFGTPVITTDEAASRELVERTDTGVIVSAGDTDALAHTIDRLISNPKRLSALKKQTEFASEAWRLEVGIAPFLKSINRHCPGVQSAP